MKSRGRLHWALLALVTSGCDEEADASLPAKTDVVVSAEPAPTERREWPFEECDPEGNNSALAACALDEGKEVRDRLDMAVRAVRDATRQDALDLGVRSDPEDPSRTVLTAYTPDDFVTAFDKAQKAWEVWRDAQCEWENIGYQATQAGLRHIESIRCTTRYDEERIAALKKNIAR